MRYIDKAAIHTQAVVIGRASKNGMKRTADRLAACNVDKQINSIVSRLKPDAWDLDDDIIIKGCSRELWIQFLQAEINTQTNK